MGFAAEALRDGPAVLYAVALRGSSTTVPDLSGNGKTLTVDGTVTGGIVGPSSDLPGAVRFTLANSSRLEMSPKVTGFGALSMSAWVRSTSTSTLVEGVDSVALTIFGQQDGNNVYGSFGLHNGRVAMYREGMARLVGNKLVSDGRWHHVGVAHASGSGTVALYVDGAVDLATTSTFNGGPTFGIDTIGAHFKSSGVPGSFFDGDIAGAAAYTSELTEVRMRAHWLAGLVRSPVRVTL